jgi:8-oxo-dGTP pyrophosphatase MutT (NUDIX family)
MAEPSTTQPGHHGVVALVTNPERTRFFIQQKDEAYRPFPLGYSLFGGAVEAGEEPAQALARELREELGAAAQALLDAGPTCVFAARPLATGFVVSLFEVVLEGRVLDSLAEVPVLEGRCGVVLDREQLRATPLVWGLHELVAAYLSEAP